MYVAYGHWATTPATGPRGRHLEPICCLGQGFVGGSVLSSPPTFGSGGAATETVI